MVHNCGVLSGSSLFVELPLNLHTKLPRSSCNTGCQRNLRQADDEMAINVHVCVTHGDQSVQRRTAQRMHVPAFAHLPETLPKSIEETNLNVLPAACMHGHLWLAGTSGWDVHRA